ncbi:sigma 54-interacting transcriptional regulator [Desulfitobacterium sp. AusDCA]|uniref:sigma 54-interacting transcriptional regulator n=1 Tax=Desulfitobacterium sp. AusDCA TaxID=3240383 RepID=UPI003DA75E1D
MKNLELSIKIYLLDFTDIKMDGGDKMTGEVFFTSPQKEFTNLLYKVKKEFNLSVSVCESTFDDAVQIARDMISQDPNRISILGSGGATLNLLRKDIGPLPFVSIYPTEYDLILALQKAKKMKCKVGVFSGETEKFSIITTLCTILNLPAKVYIYHDWQDLLIKIKQARQDGVEVVVGAGEKIASVVYLNGMDYISVLGGENTIRKAFENARAISNFQLSERIASSQVKTITAYSHEGMIAIDDKKRFTIFNHVAEPIFGLNEQEVLGKSLDELSHFKYLVKLFDQHEKRLGFLYKMPKGDLLVNRIPSFDKRQNLSSIFITFKEVAKKQEEGKASRDIIEKGLIAKYSFKDIFHVNPGMAAVIQKAKKYANTDGIVLIRGESGTGKELLAQSLHNGHLLRGKCPFVAVNCASLDDNLLRSELFGYSEGSFTGASKGGKAGLFEIAQGGTVFLDEIGKMKLDLQANLLRVLQEKEVRRIGSDRVIPVDVRVIAASNEDLEALVRKGAFREDLYFRLNVLKLTLPPLRERKDDIPCLIKFFVEKLTDKYNKPNFELSELILNKIAKQEWYGNIRQLQNFVERSVILADSESEWEDTVLELLAEEERVQVLNQINEETADNKINVRISTLEEMNAQIIQSVRARTSLNNTELAMKLGISRPTLLKMLNRNLSAFSVEL